MTPRYQTPILPSETCCVTAHDTLLDRDVSLVVRPTAPLAARMGERDELRRRAAAGDLPAALDAGDLDGRSYAAFPAGSVVIVDGEPQRRTAVEAPGTAHDAAAATAAVAPLLPAAAVTGSATLVAGPTVVQLPRQQAQHSEPRRGRAGLVLAAAVAAATLAGGTAALAHQTERPASAATSVAAAPAAVAPQSAPTAARAKTVTRSVPALTTPRDVIAYLAPRPAVAGPQAHHVLGCMHFLIGKTHSQQRAEAQEILEKLPTWAAHGGVRADVAQAARTIARETLSGHRYWA